jgi:hypothetical protein
VATRQAQPAYRRAVDSFHYLRPDGAEMFIKRGTVLAADDPAATARPEAFEPFEPARTDG